MNMNRKWNVDKETIDKLPDDVKPFVKEEMSNAEIGMLGVFIIKEKFRKFKLKVRGLFKHEKNKTGD